MHVNGMNLKAVLDAPKSHSGDDRDTEAKMHGKCRNKIAS